MVNEYEFYVIYDKATKGYFTGQRFEVVLPYQAAKYFNKNQAYRECQDMDDFNNGVSDCVVRTVKVEVR